MGGLALFLLTADITDSYFVAGAVDATYILVGAFVAPGVAMLIDRHGQRRIIGPQITVHVLAIVTLLILAGSLIGVQLGALGTTYVKDYMIKLVMASTMLIVAVSRGAKIPGYLADLNLAPALEPQLAHTLSQVSYWALVTALASAALIITVAMVKGMTQAKAEAKLKEVVSHG